MKLLLVAVSALTLAACASAAPEAPAPVAPAQTANAGPGVYAGTYALQAPNRVIDLRVWVDAQGQLNGELVGTGNQTTFRATDTEHRFLHATSDNVWVMFTVENGRATGATMGQNGREISGPRKP